MRQGNTKDTKSISVVCQLRDGFIIGEVLIFTDQGVLVSFIVWRNEKSPGELRVTILPLINIFSMSCMVNGHNLI